MQDQDHDPDANRYGILPKKLPKHQRKGSVWGNRVGHFQLACDDKTHKVKILKHVDNEFGTVYKENSEGQLEIDRYEELGLKINDDRTSVIKNNHRAP